MKRLKFNIKDRRILSIILCVAVISIFSLTMAYAALNAVLNISGNAEVVASSWNIHFDNIIYEGNGISPKITSPTNVVFETVLNMPGDKYTFTVDIVNDGSIDATIENISITTNATEEIAKILIAGVSYANGDSITSDQSIAAGEFVRLKVSVEYKKDVSAEDLPTSQTSPSFSVTFHYSQDDGYSQPVRNNGLNGFDAIDMGNSTFGDEVCLGNECFYILMEENNTEEYVDFILFAKYNLYVGNIVTVFDQDIDDDKTLTYPTITYTDVKQDSEALGFSATISDDSEEPVYNLPFYGTVPFAKSNYFGDVSATDEILKHEDNVIYPYLLEYKSYLSKIGYDILEISIPNEDFLSALGCSWDDGCAFPFVTSTSYWTSIAISAGYGIGVVKDTGMGLSKYDIPSAFGIRPLILYRYYK